MCVCACVYMHMCENASKSSMDDVKSAYHGTLGFCALSIPLGVRYAVVDRIQYD